MRKEEIKKEKEILANSEEFAEEITTVELNNTLDVIESKGVEINIPTLEKEVGIKKEKRRKNRTAAVYQYLNEYGDVLYEIERRTPGRGEPFLARHLNKETGEYDYWISDDVEMVPYNLPNVIKAIEEGTPIWLTEGESKTETLNKIGFVSTTCAFKETDKWYKSYNKYLEGANKIFIIVDNDNKSAEFAENTAQTLLEDLEDSTDIYKIYLKDIFYNIQKGGDIDDLIEAIGEERTITTLRTIEESY